MKDLLGILFCLLLAMVVGYMGGRVDGGADVHREYSRGFREGYQFRVAHPPAPTLETITTGNLLCHYAALACVQPK